MSAWVLLLFAILFEVLGTVAMKQSQGLTRLLPSILIFVFYAISFVLMALALKKIDVGIAYAVWSGLGTLMIVMIGIVAFSESMDWIKAGSIMLILVGVVGLNLGGVTHG